MGKSSKGKGLLDTLQDEQVVVGLISKLHQQLLQMEKKLDILISQSQKKPFEKSYSQNHHQRFDRSLRHDSRGQGNFSRERTFTRVVCAECSKECEIPFKPSGDRPVYCKECFAKRKQAGRLNLNRNSEPQQKQA